MRQFSTIVRSGLLFLQILATISFGQSTYYISSAGDDANNGKSASTPWKTITKVNSLTFASGDALYFRGGDKFYGQINLNQSNITLDSYGSGNKPVITGAIQLTGWTVYSGSIYVAQASSLVKNLYANGVQMTLARFPNTGFISINSKTNSTTFTAAGITQASGYWNGANCRLRTNAWTFESPVVSTQTGTTIVLTSAPHFDTFTTNWGFYLDNKLAALDAEREWYCDPGNNKVYFYAPGGVDPNTLNVYGSVLDYGVNSSSDYITVKDLEFDYQVKGGINFSAGHNISILSNTIYGGLTDGIHVSGPNCTMSNNIVQNVNGNGIQVSWGTNCVISNNTVKSIGLVKGYQSSAQAYGILSEGSYATVSNNYIDSIGYDGIFASSYDIVQQNVIKNTMFTLGDGGAIYTGADYVTVQNNIISDVTGSNEGSPLWGGTYQSWTTAHGIYFDYNSNNNVARDNTVIRAGSIALFTNYNTHNNTFSNNTAYDCASNIGGYFLYFGIDVTLNYGGHVITKNILYPASNNEYFLQVQDFSATLHSPGIIDSNYYLNSHGDPNSFTTLLSKSGSWSLDHYSFTGWNALTGQEAHSKYIIPASYKRDTVFINSTANPMMVNLPPVFFYDLDNNSVVGSFILAPFSSKVLIRDTVCVVPGNSSITVNPSSLPFGNVVINTSSERTYIVTGSNLSPAVDSLTITAPSGFTISTVGGSGFTSLKRIAYTGGTLSARAIYIRFSPTAVQSYSGNITNAGGGAITQNVTVSGTGISAPTPALTVNPVTLEFSTVIVNTVSSERTYTIGGANLSPASDTLTITAPAGFTISTVSGSGFTSSKRIAYTDGTLSAKTIYVRFSPTAVQSYSGNITNTGGGATTQNVTVSGKGIIAPTPSLTVNPQTLAFSTVRINTISSERIYTVQGSSLSPASGNITISSPSRYQVSTTSGSGFNSSLNLPYTSNTLSSTTIYVRFSPTAVQDYTGNITNAGGGAPTQNIAVTGTGISVTSAALTVNPTSLLFEDVIINTSKELTYALTGLNLSPASDSLTITASDGFTISTVSGADFTSLKKVAYIRGTLQPIPKIIFVKFSPTAEQDYTGNITNTGGSAAEQTIVISGRGIAVPPAPIGTFTVSEDTLPSEGGYITLSWTTQNAISASIDQGIGVVDADSGHILVYVDTTTVYMLTLNGPFETAQLSVRVVVAIQTNVTKTNTTPMNYVLEQNYPNPFNSTTKVTYTIPSVGISLMKSLQLKIYDILGREIVTLVDGMQTTGEHTVEWDGKNSSGQQVDSGVYFYRLQSGTFTDTKKLLLLR